MPEYIKSKGIVIHNVPYGDKNLISHIYTESHGRLSFFVYGGKSKKKRNIFLPLNKVELVFAYDTKHDLQKIKEIYSEGNFTFQFDIKKSPVIFLISELLYHYLKEEEKDEVFFDFLEKTLVFLNKVEQMPAFFSQFLIFFAYFSGVLNLPDGKKGLFFDLETQEFYDKRDKSKPVLDVVQTKYVERLLSGLAYNKSITLFPDERHDLIEKFIEYFRIKFGINRIKSYDLFRSMY